MVSDYHIGLCVSWQYLGFSWLIFQITYFKLCFILKLEWWWKCIFSLHRTLCRAHFELFLQCRYGSCSDGSLNRLFTYLRVVHLPKWLELIFDKTLPYGFSGVFVPQTHPGLQSNPTPCSSPLPHFASLTLSLGMPSFSLYMSAQIPPSCQVPPPLWTLLSLIQPLLPSSAPRSNHTAHLRVPSCSAWLR